MAVEHVNIADPDIHEPKGVATAASGKVYVADGAGSGAWSYSDDYIHFRITDINTAGSYWLVVPHAGSITKIYSVINGGFTASDVVLSFEIAGVAVTDGNITITQSGSAAGDVDSSTPSAANVLSQGQALEIITDGAGTGTVTADLTFVIERA